MTETGVIRKFMKAINLSLQAFRETMLGTAQVKPDDWGQWDYRKGRYELLWAFYRLNQYNEAINVWAEGFKHRKEVYSDIRSVFGVGRRIGEFHATHLWGGALDPMAGDGQKEPSALPIVQVASEEIRPAIARLWKDSRWASKKDTAPRFGSVMGDVAIEAVDIPRKGRVVMKVHQPTRIKDIVRDHEGHVVEYSVVEKRVDPINPNDIGDKKRYCEYLRTVRHDESTGRVEYATYRDGSLFDWGEGPESSGPEWWYGYGFAPLVMIEHIDVGLGFGDSEVAGALYQILERDHLGSMLSDQIAKILNGPWLFSGVDKINLTTVSNREKVPAFTAPKDAKAQQLVGDMPVGDIAGFLRDLKEELEHGYPELMIDRARSSGDMSGKSIREAKKPAETKIKSRRASYDEALVSAHQMGISIGAYQNYDGYTAFTPDSFRAGDLDHRIGDRNVFQMDVFDRQEMKLGTWVGIKSARDAGMALEDAFTEYGFPADIIQRAKSEMEAQAAREQGGLAAQNVTNRPTFDRQPVT